MRETNVAVIANVSQQVSMSHERQNDKWHFITVNHDANQTQHMLMLKLSHCQCLVQERPHLHCTRTMTLCSQSSRKRSEQLQQYVINTSRTLLYVTLIGYVFGPFKSFKSLTFAQFESTQAIWFPRAATSKTNHPILVWPPIRGPHSQCQF